MKKNFFMLVISTLVLISCGKNSSDYKELQSQYDSLKLITDNYENDLSETDSLIASILSNFQEISSVENMINISNSNGDIRKNDADRIKDNVKLIQEKLNASSVAINELNEKLKTSSVNNKRLALTVSALSKQLQEQKNKIETLVMELQRKDAQLMDLDNQINGLNSNIDDLNKSKSQQEAMLKAQDRELNAVRYAIGTKGDLKDFKILVDGKISMHTADMSYFKDVDKRDLSQIDLGETSKAKLLTIHPEGSYQLNKSDKNMTLVITNKELFWSSSKTLVIQVY